jgi:hypothetical protein
MENEIWITSMYFLMVKEEIAIVCLVVVVELLW